jgi:DNA uptake protein ComE-like DNA-binding protein
VSNYKKDRQNRCSILDTGYSKLETSIENRAVRIEKGLVLLAVLWLVVVLMVIVAVLGRKARLDSKVCLSRMEGVRCKWAGRAGIEKAIGILNEDNRESDGLIDLWSDNDTDLNDIMLEGCYFSVIVFDEASKLNINTATKEQLMWLPNMVEDIADAIIDWRDSDDTPSGTGVEGGYYENLSFRYMVRNGPFKTIRELLLVKGVTEELFYGEDTNFNGQLDYNERDKDESPPADDGDDVLDRGWVEYLTCYSYDNNKDATGSTRVNVNSANQNELESALGISRGQARWIVDNRRSRNYQSIGDLISDSSPKEPSGASADPNAAQPIDMQTFDRIADMITVSSGQRVDGKVNINTASDVVLTALLGGDDVAERIADDIVNYRDSLSTGMTSIADVMQVGSVNLEAFKRIANNITTRSDVFTIHCVATADRNGSNGAVLQTEVVVDRSPMPCEILYWYEGVSN